MPVDNIIEPSAYQLSAALLNVTANAFALYLVPGILPNR